MRNLFSLIIAVLFIVDASAETVIQGGSNEPLKIAVRKSLELYLFASGE
jgi:hypothetical protein